MPNLRIVQCASLVNISIVVLLLDLDHKFFCWMELDLSELQVFIYFVTEIVYVYFFVTLYISSNVCDNALWLHN